MRSQATLLNFLAAAAASIFAAGGCHEPSQIDCQIVGHSMAPSFKSAHSIASCEECGFEFACDLVTTGGERSVSVICGNCGCQSIEKIVPRSADRVKLIPGHPVNRWDVVAFRRGDRVLVKRVVGLPGEKVDFCHGNLVIDGRVAEKPTDICHKVSTCVFDSRPVSPAGNSMNFKERLVPREADVWEFTGPALLHNAAATHGDVAGKEFDFLDYRHRKCYKHSGDPSALVEVDDSNPFNQSIRRSTHAVDELEVRVEAAFAQKGSIQIRRQTTEGSIIATVKFSQDKTVDLSLTRKAWGDAKTLKREGVKVSDGDVVVALVNYDDLIHLFINEMKGVGPIRLEPADNAERLRIDLSKPFVSVGVSRKDSITIRRISIWRDWYLYQQAPKPSVNLPLQLSDQGYYVVGDNLPVSEDSRHFGSVEDIIGVVQPSNGR